MTALTAICQHLGYFTYIYIRQFQNVYNCSFIISYAISIHQYALHNYVHRKIKLRKLKAISQHIKEKKQIFLQYNDFDTFPRCVDLSVSVTFCLRTCQAYLTLLFYFIDQIS